MYGPGKGFLNKFSDALYIEQKELRICSITSHELLAISAVHKILHGLIKGQNVGLHGRTLPIESMLKMNPIKKL